jgi:hypothetical protein
MWSNAVHWVHDGGYLKYFDVKKLEQIDEIRYKQLFSTFLSFIP